MIFALAAGTVVLLVFIFILVYLAIFSNRARIQRQMRRLQTETDDKEVVLAREVEEQQLIVSRKLSQIPLGQRTIIPLLKKLQKKIQNLAPKGIQEELEQRLMLTGKQDSWKVSHVVIIWLFSICFFSAFTFLLTTTGEYDFLQKVVMAGLGAVLGAVLPFTVLNSIISKRKRLIRRQLPEFLDLLCVSVQAGLSFDSGVAHIVQAMKGPLIDECERMQRDMRMGQMRRRSLQQMAKRCDVEELYLVVTAVIQADRLGTSMAKTLTVQADSMRERHRQNVRKASLQAPIKMIFPMVFCILPMLFAIMLLNPIITIIESLANLGW